jgi:MoaA/NifB/PqqE/SkfB family radical SAM enzyme
MVDVLKNYICIIPFSYLEIHKYNVHGCCPSWLTIPYGNVDNLGEIWNGEIATNVRQSVLDGIYTYCDKNNCPHLSQLINNNDASGIFIKKSLQESLKIDGPSRLNLCFDNSCNLSCPSCRKDIIISDEKDRLKNNKILEDLSFNFKDTVDSLYISGTSDPFASKTFIDFLENFKDDIFPKLKIIHIHTNGLLLDEKMWNRIKKAHKYIKTIEVSIDAATKETYEKIRRGGNWERLNRNLNFISSIPTIYNKSYSFVVQDTNYKEMKMFYDFISSLPHYHKNNYNVYFGKILNWGTYTDDEFFIKQIWNELHPNFNDFLVELKKIGMIYNSNNNMNDIVEKYNLKEIKTRLI